MGAVKRVCSLSRSRERALPTFPLVLLSCAFFAVAAFAGDTIVPGDGISGNETLVSKNGDFELGFFSPGDNIHFFLGVRFKKMPSTSPNFWVGNRVPITDLPSAALEVFGGSLCIKEAGASLWCSSAATSPPTAAAVLLDNGNLVVRDQANTGINISMTYEHYPLNGSISVDRSRRNGFVLTADGGLDTPGTFPDWMVTSQDNGSSLILNRPNPNVIEFLQLHMGQVSLMRRSEDSAAVNKSGWVARWTFPSDCKSGAFFCGTFGSCTSNGKCTCLDGFEPSYPVEWGLGYFVAGCSRSLPLSCETNGQTEHDDSFILIDKLQGLPYNPVDDSAESDGDCEQACFSNCYCVAYVYDSGCKLWYDKLYNLTFASRPPYSKVYVRWGSELRAKNGLHTRAIYLFVSGFIALAFVILILALLWRHRRDLFTCRKFEVEGSLVFYSYGQIKKATRNFSDKLGEGGFGSVFRGTMPGPEPTAIGVKRLKGRGHADKQFRAEVQTVGVVKHTNLVRLLGFCVKGDMRLLVYEYMPNGSLDSHLFSEKSSLLNWDLRYRIALDFGMAKLLGREFNSALTTMRGTMGYLAPEWISGQPITKKADVYSFGIVLLEIVSGRRTTKRLKFGSHRYFPLYAAAQVNEGNVLCLLDSRLEGNANVKELDIACRVACWCIQDDEDDRPSIGQVVRMLEGIVDTEIPPIPPSLHNLMEEGDSSSIYSD
ncbi:unnamed protein product [Urochloa decumbens]|uniref:non-specific serine/threonine protein kinase n=1 Tax=Urochloa decumbens TaxID=240449 RepID=A0ABC9AJS9_9POAL